MGRGGDKGVRPRVSKEFSVDGIKKDLASIKSRWTAQSKVGNAGCLWGRSPMLAAVASRLRSERGIVWVDLGAGQEGHGIDNVTIMFEYLPRLQFEEIYVVNPSRAYCEKARAQVEANGWDNVHVVENDASDFRLKGLATLVTFSYSLSMIHSFHGAVENAVSYLAPNGYAGVADFYVSSRNDLPLRQTISSKRFFWRLFFDMKNLDIGPDRRNYLDFKLDRAWEVNSQGSVPFLPYFHAPWYAWVGQKKDDGESDVHHEVLVESPPMFPPTFLYTMSWEDPDVDMKVLQISKDDVCLTLTSGGCNSLNLALEGAKAVYSVDCNPAQSALLEMKVTAIKQLGFDDMWRLFGEGKHPNIANIYKHHLAPNMCQKSIKFWNKKLYHFHKGLYYAGGMGKACLLLQWLCWMMGMTGTVHRLTHASTIEEQRAVWESIWLVRLLRTGPSFIVWLVTKFLTIVFLNRFFLWFCGGVPGKQYMLIMEDGNSIAKYLVRTFDGVARYSHLRRENYFYFNCLTGHYMRDNCPSYLKEENFRALKAGPIDNVHAISGSFNDQLRARKYNKVILMDHVDWMDEHQAREVTELLGEQVVPGGRVIWRSAGLCPPYTSMIEEAGFEVKCIHRADRPQCYYMDRVNMYNSFYLAIKKQP